MRRRLPAHGSEEARQWCEVWDKADHQGKEALCEKVPGGITYSSGAHFRSECGIPLAEPRRIEDIQENLEKFNIKLPPVKLIAYKPTHKRGKGDPETQVGVLGDWHADEVTPSFNKEVLVTRVNKLVKGILNITYLHRNLYPIDDLVLLVVGDMVHGENPKQGARPGTITGGAQKQVFDIALPLLNNVVATMRQHFATVRVVLIPGNHGRISKDAPQTSNWDIVLAKAMAGYKLGPGIKVQPVEEWCALVDIQGKRFFVFHGDQVRATQGIPYFAMHRKVGAWFVTYGGFDYAVSGHFHKDDFLRVNARVKHFGNGAMPTDDPYALSVIGTSAVPSQWTFGVHARQGVTWAYSLVVDDAFLPGCAPVTSPLVA